MTRQEPPEAPAILFYDRECRFCIWGVVGIAHRARPGSLRLAPIQGDRGQRVLAGVEPGRRLESWHLWDGTRLRSGADVVDGLAPRVATWWLRVLAEAARWTPRPVASAVYRQVAARRVLLSRLVPQAAKRCAADGLARYEAPPR
ncbi:thiol-disulfide oxidoreductase DCC family protein [Patulibacter americanus]|uniref:thiol-disulfide oxidoreductase DCC family protein n=1 Tax=Patulibacter americanus TaxID=588672 RepID=UPI0003B48CEE|nr:DCC1-like thiol-disulfide oxidoreductase family protein [Patulibacter americanus]